MNVSEFIVVLLFGIWDYYVMVSVITTSTIVACLIYNYITGSTVGKDLLVRLVAMRTSEFSSVLGSVASQGQFGAVLSNLAGMVSKAVDDMRTTDIQHITAPPIMPDDESDNMINARLHTLSNSTSTANVENTMSSTEK